MKASLVLKMGQQLSMTPQLQQAIRLLQMSTLDLQEEIQEALESNPMLELEEDGTSVQSDPDAAKKSASDESTAPQENSQSTDTAAAAEQPATQSDDWPEQIPSELEIDTSWDDIYQSSASSNIPSSNSEEWDFTSTTSVGVDLQSHLLWQLNLAKMTETDRTIATVIIDSIGEDGYLQESLEEIQSAFDPMQHIEMDEVEMVLKRVQQFEPTGIAARDLSECLLLQLHSLPSDTAWLAQAQQLCAEHLELLGARDYNQIMRRMRIKEDALKNIVQLIQTLNPRPGSVIESKEPEYIVPDVIVRKATTVGLLSSTLKLPLVWRLTPITPVLYAAPTTALTTHFYVRNCKKRAGLLKAYKAAMKPYSKSQRKFLITNGVSLTMALKP